MTSPKITEIIEIIRSVYLLFKCILSLYNILMYIDMIVNDFMIIKTKLLIASDNFKTIKYRIFLNYRLLLERIIHSN